MTDRTKNTHKSTKILTKTKKTVPVKKTVKPPEEANSETPVLQDSGFLIDAAENIEEGAKIVGEKAEELGEKASVLAQTLMKKLKKSVDDVLEGGSKISGQLQHTANEYQDKYKKTMERKNLQKNQTLLFSQLGKEIYRLYKEEQRKQVSFSAKNIAALLEQINKINKQLALL